MPGHRLILRPKSKRDEHSPLAIHTAAFVHVLVLLAAGFSLCFGKSINLTCSTIPGGLSPGLGGATPHDMMPMAREPER